MKIYKDKELTQEIDGNILDGGIVDAGETKIVTFYVQNDSSAILQDLKFAVDDKEIEIIEAPIELQKLESKKLVIKAIADVNIEKRIEGRIKITGKKLWE